MHSEGCVAASTMLLADGAINAKEEPLASPTAGAYNGYGKVLARWDILAVEFELKTVIKVGVWLVGLPRLTEISVTCG